MYRLPPLKVVFVTMKYATHPSPYPRLLLFNSRSNAGIFLEVKAEINSVMMLLTSGLNIVR
jgi:hypothetical protein